MTALAAEGVRLALGGRPVLDGIDLTFKGPGLIGVIGPNGAGKTTLLRCLAGLAKPDSGNVLADGQAISSLRPQERARRIGYLAQSPILHWPLTVGRLVALGRLPHLAPWARPGTNDQAAIDRALASTDLTDLVDRRAHTLSGGEFARALLARVIAGDPATILADEPTAALDPLHRLRILDLFRRLADSGQLIVIVLHDLTLALRFCDRVVLMNQGRIEADGPPDAIADDPALSRTFGVTFARPTWQGHDLLLPWRPEAQP